MTKPSSLLPESTVHNTIKSTNFRINLDYEDHVIPKPGERGQGGPLTPKYLAYQLTLANRRRADYAHQLPLAQKSFSASGITEYKKILLLLTRHRLKYVIPKK